MNFIDSFEEQVQEAGIFTWSLDTDTLYGDTLIAALFGLDPEETVRGLPLASFIVRIHIDDKPRVAGLISNAVKTGQPYQAEYRVLDAFDEARWVMATGRCFRDRSGNPSHYAGIVYPIDALHHL
jgi:PAS domain-containing protein